MLASFDFSLSNRILPLLHVRVVILAFTAAAAWLSWAPAPLEGRVAVTVRGTDGGSCGRCDSPDWTYSPVSGGLCYRLNKQRVGWNVAESWCMVEQAHQPSVHNMAENLFVAELARTVPGPIWLGVAQFGSSSRQYEWSDQSHFRFEHWPNNVRPAFNRGKKCVKLDGMTGEWVQSCCRVPAPYVCVKPATAVPASSNKATAAILPQPISKTKS